MTIVEEMKAEEVEQESKQRQLNYPTKMTMSLRNLHLLDAFSGSVACTNPNKTEKNFSLSGSVDKVNECSLESNSMGSC